MFDDDGGVSAPENKTRNSSRDETAKRKVMMYPLHLTFPLGVIPLDDPRDFWWVSCRMARLQYGAKISPNS